MAMDIKELKAALNSKDGEVILSYLSNVCGEKDSSFVVGDQSLTAFKEGRRSVILDLNKKRDIIIDEVKQSNLYKVTY